jgi:putative tryptophan/tyrosine transport system substrate-binding protein
MKKAAVSSFLVVALLFAYSFSVHAQQPQKVPRIGYLSALDPARESARAKEIRQALRERGHIEGQNIAFEYRYTEGKSTALLSLRPSWCVLKLISSS